MLESTRVRVRVRVRVRQRGEKTRLTPAPELPRPADRRRTPRRQNARRLLTLGALLPLTVILAVKAASLGTEVFVNAYGMGVLGATILVMYLSFGSYRDPSSDATVLTSRPLVSCLLAVRDDVAAIEATIRSLLAQTYGNCEVVVVDDFSTDGTRELLTDLAGRLPFTLVTLDRNVGKKRALVRAVEAANGGYYVFTDSDCVLADDAVERCMLAFQAHPGIGAVSGHARALNRDQSLLTKIQDVWYDGQFGVSKAGESVFRSVSCVSGPLAAFRREAIFNYLPAWAGDRFLGREFRFATDRQLTGYVLGQYWIGRDLKRQYADSPFVTSVDYPERKWGVAYVSSARAWTNVPDTFGRVLRQQARWKKSFIRNLFFTGRFYWRRGILASALFYGHALWVLLAPLLAFRHLVWLPLHGQFLLTGLYLGGVLLKGSIWGLAYRSQNRGDGRWIYRPLMSLLSATVLSWLLIYSLCTLRKNVWSRG
jgi:cellulose synthase/poly-beta-1,6-N-acetylglucosamine synthase-like glycosyltransferase